MEVSHHNGMKGAANFYCNRKKKINSKLVWGLQTAEFDFVVIACHTQPQNNAILSPIHSQRVAKVMLYV